jgi:hypothetical protein
MAICKRCDDPRCRGCKERAEAGVGDVCVLQRSGGYFVCRVIDVDGSGNIRTATDGYARVLDVIPPETRWVFRRDQMKNPDAPLPRDVFLQVSDVRDALIPNLIQP